MKVKKVNLPNPAGCVTATQGRRSVQRKLYIEEEDENNGEAERGKKGQVGSFVL